MQQKYWYCLLLLLLIPGVLFAQSGKIRGTIVDQKTKEPLIGANITVEETNLGAATDVDGTYLIIDVNVGTYTLKATYIGYRSITMSNIRVSQNFTTEANFELPSEDVQVQTVEIIAERPLLNKDYTNTLQAKTSEDLAVLPIRGVSNIVALQASVVKNDGSNSIYIRGGRAEETNVMIDGVSMVNPLHGEASAAFTYLNQNSIEELQVQTGGFTAEYGSAMSGVINVTTKEAGSKYTFGGEVITDGFLTPESGNGWGYNVYNITAGGPVIPESNLISFFIGVERQYLGDNDPRVNVGYKANTSTQSWDFSGKISVRPVKEVEVRLGGTGYLRHGNNWDNVNRFYNPQHNQKFDNSTYTAFGQLTHNIGTNFFYTFQVGYFLEKLASGDPVWWDNFKGVGDTLQDPYLASQGTAQSRIYSLVAVANSPFYFNQQRWGFEKSKSENIDIKGDVNWQMSSHLIKAGFDVKTFTIRHYALSPIQLATTAGSGQFPDWLRYRNNDAEYYGYTYDGKSESDANDWFGSRTDGPRKPLYLAAYLQDKVELSDLVLNIGLRADYFDANDYVVKDPLNPFGARGTPGGGVFDPSDIKQSKGTTTVSPRLGFSFPITDRAVFHAQYGTYLQMPPLEDVLISRTYEEYIMAESPYSVEIANPNLKPERTNSYEVGFRQVLTENSVFGVTGFYKEIKDLIQARNIGIGDIKAYPASYQTFENVDFGTVKGFDFIFELRRTHGIMFNINYTLSYANGTGSSPDQLTRVVWIQTANPKMINPLDNDRRHNGSVNVDYRISSNEGPSIGGVHPFENSGINLMLTFNSGVPYTQSQIYNPYFGALTTIIPTGAINSATGPWNYRVDLRIDRSFKISDINLIASLYIINLTDAQNVFTVFRGTGEANNTGWLGTQDGQSWAQQNGSGAVALFNARQNNPFNYGVPRMIRLGLKVEY